MTVARNLSLLSPNVSSSGTVNNAGLTNSSITINGTAVALGGTGSLNSADSFSVNSLNIATNATPAVFVKDDNLTSWDYSGKSFSVSGQETTPAGIFFKPDGLAMYVVGQSGDDVNQYSLSIAWDVSTAAFVRVSAVIGETGPTGIFFKPDGTVMYITGFTNDTVREFNLSTAWDVSTITFVRDFSVVAQDTTPQDIWFKPDGTKVYIVGSTNDGIYEYNLSTAWNISTASFVQFFSVAAQDTVPVAIAFNPDGTKMYVLGDTGDDINRYSLSTPWNISTAVFFNNFYVGFQELSPQGLFINFDSGTAYVVGSSTDAVYQYNTLTDGIELLSSSGLFIDGSLYTNKNLVVTAGTRIGGTLSVSSSATIGSLSVGTTTITGTPTLGTGTGALTVSLGAGATTSGSLKILNIGNAGLSGSTTNINIGSNVSGSLGTTTISAPTVNIGQTATQFAVTNTASAVNYVQVTGGATGQRVRVEAQGSDTNIDLRLGSKGSGGVYSHGFFVANANSFNNVLIQGGVTGSSPFIQAQGGDTNIGLNLTSKGTGELSLSTGSTNPLSLVVQDDITAAPTPTSIYVINASSGLGRAAIRSSKALYLASGSTNSIAFLTNSSKTAEGSTQFQVTNTTSAVNYVQVTGSATGASPTISPQGSDANIALNFAGKGSGSIVIQSWVQAARGSTNYWQLAGANSGSAPVLSVLGNDTNIDLALTPKGTGTIVANGPFTATGQTDLGGPVANPVFRVNTSTSIQFLDVFGSTTGTTLIRSWSTNGSSSGLNLQTRGGSGFNFHTSGGANQQAAIAHTASAVNYVQVTGGVTSPSDVSIPTISVQGSDSSTYLGIGVKGTNGYISFYNGGAPSATTTLFRVLNTAGILANFIGVSAATTTNSPIISANGIDTNIDLALTPKGTGKVVVSTSLQIDTNLVIDAFTLTTAATTPNQVLAALDATVYRAAKLLIRAVDAAGAKYHTTEILAIHNGITANSTEYGSVDIGGTCATFDVDYSAGTLRLLATPTSANSTVFTVAVQLLK